MTSRVQKGGAIFRPVAKSRARPDVRQPSVTADTSSSTHYAINPSLSSTSMPPPAAVPSHISPTSPMQTAIPDHPSSPEVLPSNSDVSVSINTTGRPPTLGTSRSSTVITNSTRSTLSPPMLMSRTTLAPIVPTRAPPSVAPSSSTAPPLPSRIQDATSGAVSQPAFSHLHILHHSGAENVPPSRLHAGVIIKSQGTTTEKEAIITAPDSSHELASDSNLQQVEPGTVKPTKRRSSRANSSSRSPTKRKKKAASTSDAEGSEDDTPEPARRKRKRRASSGTPRSRRSRGPSLPPYDPDADPGEEIDPTTVTMASLCDDTGQGRVSRKAAEILSNHAAWKAQNREKRVRMKAFMELKKYGRDVEVEAIEADSAPGETADPGPSDTPPASPAIIDDTGSGFDYSQDLATSRFNVQVRIGPNGETVIDEESLVVDRTEGEDTTHYTHVVESDHTKFVNSGSYGKRYRGSRWSAEETELFYDALAQYGENYELIAYVLPGRDRKSCKNKFKAEDKKNPARINHCLNNYIPVDMATLSRMTGKDFSGPIPEIRVPSPQPTVEPAPATAQQETPSSDHARKKKSQKKSPDDGVVIIGEADGFVAFPASP